MPEPARGRSGMAVAGMVSSIVGLVSCLTVIPSLLGTIFGFVGAHQVKRSHGSLTGLGIARAGWIVGLIGTVAGVALWIAMAVDGAFDDVPGRGLQVGTCVDLDDELSGYGSPSPTVGCDTPHDAEVYEIGWLNPTRDRSYPGVAELIDEATAACVGEPFTDYVGVGSDESGLRVEVLIAPSDEWSNWRGEYGCLIVAREGSLTGTVHRSGR
jgi:Domain of unknown function (DUF4190)